MPKYKNYKNKHTNNPVIHTVEDLVKMSFEDVVKREKELASQYKQIGFPTNSDMQNSSNVVYVHEYTREDGTVVRAHWRSKVERAVVNNEASNNNISEQVKDFETYSDYIGNEASVPNNQKTPIYPENGVVKGGISNDYVKKEDNILLKSEGYVTPTKLSRNYSNIDKAAIKFNAEQNKNRPDAKQMLEIGIYGVDSYEDNSQFKHIKDGSADLYNEKYNLTGNKTIPSDMKGIEFSINSDFSKRISGDKKFQRTIRNAIAKNNGKIPAKIELDFGHDKNLNYSIGHGTFLNTKISKNGYIEGIVFDKYDYDKNLKSKDYKENPFINTANNSAVQMHKHGNLEYYYYFVPARFKK